MVPQLCSAVLVSWGQVAHDLCKPGLIGLGHCRHLVRALQQICVAVKAHLIDAGKHYSGVEEYFF